MEVLELDKPLSSTVDIECDRIRASDDIGKPPFVLLIDGVGKMSRGNISSWSGIAKSKKTFALTLIMAGLVKRESIHHKFQPMVTKNIAWIDTEQSPYDAQVVTKRIKSMCGSDENMMFYGLRRYGYKTRIEKIEGLLLKHGADIDLLVIDGIRDLVADFNDAVESSNMIAKLMQWTVDYDIHITTVLHGNKSDGNMRGHLGTELENKCEAAFKVTRDENINDASLVEETFGRGKSVEPFKIKINAEGLPEVLENDHFGIDENNNDAPWER